MGVTMKSPKTIETSRSMRGHFVVPCPWHKHMIPHEQTECNTKSVCSHRFVGLHKKGVSNMDIMLHRILSLIPRKENGDFKHGEQSKFARAIGFKDGHIISDWVAGNSESYRNYLYQIAAKYDVSVEWLKGETDEKSPAPEGAELSEARMKLLAAIDGMSEEEVLAMVQMAEAAKKMRGDGKL
jgi:hypothetical protein